MKRMSVFICAVWMIGVVPNAYGACTDYLPVFSGCGSDAGCEEETTPGGPMAVACPVFSVDGKFYIGIDRHTFTHACVQTHVYDDTNCTYRTTGTCVTRPTSTTRYACCSGYYGQCTDNTDITTCSCSRCPQFSDTSETVYGTTEGPVARNADNYSGKATSKTHCYIPADTGYKDSDGIGTFEFTSKCYYSN